MTVPRVLSTDSSGGAKDGKCEVDGNKDCAWEKIYRRLEKQGRLEEFLNQPVQLRDYSKTNFKVINDYVKAVREERFAGYYGGVHPSERKEFSEHLSLKRFPEPKTVCYFHVTASWRSCKSDCAGGRYR